MASSEAEEGVFSFARRSDLSAEGGDTSPSPGVFDFGSDSDAGVTSVESDHPDSAFESEGSCDTSHEPARSGGTYQGKSPVATYATSRDASAVRAFGPQNATHRPAFPHRQRTPVFPNERDVGVVARVAEGETAPPAASPPGSNTPPRELPLGEGTEGVGRRDGGKNKSQRYVLNDWNELGNAAENQTQTRRDERRNLIPWSETRMPVLTRQSAFTETSSIDFETKANSKLWSLHSALKTLHGENAALRDEIEEMRNDLEKSRAAADTRFEALEGKTSTLVTKAALRELKNNTETKWSERVLSSTNDAAFSGVEMAVHAKSMASIERHVLDSLETAMRSVDIHDFVEGLVADSLDTEPARHLVDRSVRKSLVGQTKKLFSDRNSHASLAVDRMRCATRRATRRAAAVEGILTAVEKRIENAGADSETALNALRNGGYFPDGLFVETAEVDLRRAGGAQNFTSNEQRAKVSTSQSTMGDIAETVDLGLRDLRRAVSDDSKRNTARYLLAKEEFEKTCGRLARRLGNRRESEYEKELWRNASVHVDVANEPRTKQSHRADTNLTVSRVEKNVTRHNSAGELRVPTGTPTRPKNSTRFASSASSKPKSTRFFLDKNSEYPVSPAFVSSQNVFKSRKRAESTVERIDKLVAGGGDELLSQEGNAPVQLAHVPRLLDFEKSGVTGAAKSALTFSGVKAYEPDHNGSTVSLLVTAKSPRSRKRDIMGRSA